MVRSSAPERGEAAGSSVEALLAAVRALPPDAREAEDRVPTALTLAGGPVGHEVAMAVPLDALLARAVPHRL